MVSSMSRGLRLASLCICIGFLFIIGWTTSGAAAGSFFPVEEVKAGQWGIAHTVVQGTTIETFSVEVLGLLENAGPTGDLIMVKASGGVIERTNGIAAGMSGSPVYIDGKLLGAIAYAFVNDPTIGLVTPIGDMLELLKTMARSPVASDDVLALASSEDPPHGVAAPIGSPLMVSGLGDRAFERLGAGLSKYNLVPMRSAGIGSVVADSPVEPGSAIAAQLVRGDINVSHIGTLTYVHDGQFLAFGHSMLNSGAVDYVASHAYIHRTIGAYGSAMKLGAPLEPFGRILQDRGAGLAGQFDEYPATVRFSVNIFDHDLDRESTFEAEMVNNEMLLIDLAATAALEAFDRGIDRVGPGWARVNVHMHGSGLPRPVERENLFYSAYDIAAEALGELLWGIQEFALNEFAAVNFEEIRIDIEVGEQRRTARILSAVPERTEVFPGETVAVEVTIRPYRGEVLTEIVYLSIPDDSSSGEVVVVARPGMFPYLLAEEIVTDEVSIFSDEGDMDAFQSSADSLEQLIDAFQTEERNDEIVLEYFPPFVPSQTDEDEFGEEYGDSTGLTYDWDAWPDAVIVAKLTDYVIEGSSTFSLNILEPVVDQKPAVPDVRRWRNSGRAIDSLN